MSQPTPEDDPAPEPVEVSMKPLLGRLVEEAVVLALLDSITLPSVEGAEDAHEVTGPGGSRWERHPTADEADQWRRHPGSIPEQALASVSPGVLARNVGNRLLGTGGWTVGDVYGGNASAQQLLDASIARPRGSDTMDLAAMVGEHFDTTTDVDKIQGGDNDAGL